MTVILPDESYTVLERSFLRGTKAQTWLTLTSWEEKQIVKVVCLLKANYLNIIIVVSEKTEFNSYTHKYVQILNRWFLST